MSRPLAIARAILIVILLPPLTVAALSLLLLVLLIPADMLLNNAILQTFERNFAAIDHPLQTKPLATKSYIGNLGCASNHCDYFVGNLRTSRLPRNELETHYRNTVIPAPDDPHFGEYSNVLISYFDEETSECDPALDALFTEPAMWGVDPSAYKDETLYIVYAEESGAAPGADIRCH